MHSPTQERKVFKFLIGLSVLSVVGFFNNCSRPNAVDMNAPAYVEMSSNSQVESENKAKQELPADLQGHL